MATILTEDQRVALTATFTNAKGNPAQVQNPVWSSSNPAILTMADLTAEERTARGIAADAVASWASAVGPLGTAQAQLTGDADLGDGVREITGLHDLEVRGAEATHVLIAAGAPEAKA